MEQWSGKVAIVVGASSGIGEAIVQKLLQNGLKVVGLARRLDRLQSLSTTTNFYPIQCDISKTESIDKAFETIKNTLGTAHILINNAGVMNEHGLVVEGHSSYEMWRYHFDINLLGLMACTSTFMKQLPMDETGHLIYINSVAGHYIPYHNSLLGTYPITKHALTAYTLSLRKELLSLNRIKVKVTNLSPGLVATEMTTINPKLSAERKLAFTKIPILSSYDVADGVLYALATPLHLQVEQLTLTPTASSYY